MSTTMVRIKDFWQKYEEKIILVIGLLLVAVISFEGGFLKGKTQNEGSIALEKGTFCPETKPINCPNTNTIIPGEIPNVSQSPETNSAQNNDCAFVGSKNSDKYHLPTCSGAKRIKPENIVCFKSAEEAAQKGYQPSKDCLK